MNKQTPSAKRELEEERSEVLGQLESWLETPMLVLGFAWLALLVAELISGLNAILEGIGTIIWLVFILEFIVKLTLAPQKLAYLKTNWLTAFSLLLPALRIFRVVRIVRLLRVTRVARGVRLVRVVTSVNRGMKALGASMERRGVRYVVALTLIVTLAGAAGMYTFENDVPGRTGLKSFGAALWWTAMIMTTLGSEHWPQTAEGRVLCFVLALYAFGVFGYLTASLATFFIGRDAESDKGELAGAKAIQEIRLEIASLRVEIRELMSQQTDRK